MLIERIKRELKKNKYILSYILAKRIVDKNIDFDDVDFIILMKSLKMGKKKSKPIIKINLQNESGFFALFLASLEASYHFIEQGFIPYLNFTNKTSYYDHKYTQEKGIENVFEYFFRQKKFNLRYDLNEYNNVYIPFNERFNSIQKKYNIKSHYELIYDDTVLKIFAKIYNDLFELNQETSININHDKSELKLAEGYVGVHFRGTDFRYNLKEHPKFVLEEDYFKEIDIILEYNPKLEIFLATEDQNSLNNFILRYGSKIKYYQDCDRSNTTSVGYYSKNDRVFHEFKSGYEVLRDVVTLSDSNYLICGTSNVSVATKIFKIARNIQTKEIKILDNGISNHGKKLVDIDKNFKDIVEVKRMIK